MDKVLLESKVVDYVANLDKKGVKDFFPLAKTPEWALVVELGDLVTHDELTSLKVVAMNWRVPGYILSDDALLLLFVAEMMTRFYKRK